MPLDKNGVFFITDGDERAYESESAYYLNFQIRSALASIYHIQNKDDSYKWENRYQMFHYYSDHLLYSIGQINNRFIVTGKEKKEIYVIRKRANRNNFLFSEKDFPILSDKRARNMIEHIDECNQDIIVTARGVGGFNLIDEETEPELACDLRKKRDTHPYTLDLINGEILLKKGSDIFGISIDELKKELERLLENVDRIREFLRFPFS